MKKLFLPLIILLSWLPWLLNGQCANNNIYYVTRNAPTVVGYVDDLVNFMPAGRYILLTGMVAGNTYRIETCGDDDFDTEITIYAASGGGSLAYSDDACGLQSRVDFTPPSSGNYRILLDEYPCQSNNTYNMTVKATLMSIAADPCDGITSLSCDNSTSYSLPSGHGSWNGYGPYSTPGNEQVFSFTPLFSGTHDITVTHPSSSYVDLFYKSGNCSNSGWTYVDDIWYNATNQVYLTGGTTYYFLLDDENTSASYGSITIDCPEPDPCDFVTPLSCEELTNYTLPSGNGAWNSLGGPYGTPGKEKIFSYTPNVTGNHEIAITHGNSWYIDLFYKSGSCSNTGWTYVDDIGVSESNTLYLTSGVTYYFLLDDENTSPSSGTIYVQDLLPPVPVCNDYTLNLFGGDESVTILDGFSVGGSSYTNCGGVAVGVYPFAFDCGDIGTHTVIVTVSDASNGLSTSCTATVTVTDTDGHCNEAVVAVCKNLSLNADVNCQANAAAADFDGGSYDPDGDPLTFSVDPVGPYPLGITTVTLTVEDGNGSVDMCTATVTVTDVSDPVITCPSNILVSLLDTENPTSSICAKVVDYELPTVTDNCGSLDFPTSLPGFTYKGIFGDNAYFLSNSATTPEDANAQAMAMGGHLVTIGSAAEDAFVAGMDPGRIWIGFTDNVTEGDWQWVTGEPVTYTNWEVGEPNDAGVGEDWAVTNWYGHWNDLYSYETALFVVEFEGGTFDPFLLSGLGSGGTFPVGTSTETWKVVDGAGNSDECSFTVTVVDNQLPNAVCKPATVQLNAGGFATVSVSDINGGSSDPCGIETMWVNTPTLDCSHLGETSVILQVMDVNGNISGCSATVTVEDNIDPEITCPGPIVQGTDPGLCGASVDFVVTATDNCDETTIVCLVGGEGGEEPSGECATNNVDLSITFDNYPEETSWMIMSSTAGVVASGGPYIGQPDGSTINLSFNLPDGDYMFGIMDTAGDGICCGIFGDGSYTLSSEGEVIGSGGDFGSADKVMFCVEAATVGSGPAMEVQSGDFFPVGTTTVTCIVTDGSEHTDICTFDITVNDSEAPQIDTPCPESITLCGAQNVDWIPPTATDNCAVVDSYNNYDPGDFFDVGSYVVTYTFYDEVGLSVSCSFGITIHPVPEVTISQEDVPLWCQGIQVLTANVLNPEELTYPLTFEWSDGLGGSPIVIAPANGEYSVIVTDALGCSTEVSTLVDENISELLSAYTIISGEEFEMYASDVLGGGVGIEEAEEAEIAMNSNIFTFLRADADGVVVDGTSFINEFIDDDFELDFPPFQGNPYSNSTTLTVPANTTMTLTGSNYGYVTVQTGATLILDVPQIYIRNLITEDNVTILLTQPTEIMIRAKMRIGESNIINPDGYTSVLYTSDNASIGQGSDVIMNIYAPEGLDVSDSGASMTTYMTGMFISQDRVISDHNVVWNWNLNCSFLPMYDDPPVIDLSQSTGDGVETIASESTEKLPSGIHVFPNPTSGVVNIEIPDLVGQKVEYVVYDSFGKEVMKREIDQLELPVIQIDMSSAQLAEGIYQVSLKGAQEMKTARFVLSK